MATKSTLRRRSLQAQQDVTSSFTPEELEEIETYFQRYETDGSGSIAVEDAKAIYCSIGVPNEVIDAMLSGQDAHISFIDFLKLYSSCKTGTDNSSLAAVMKRGSFRVQIKSKGGIHHTFSVGESYAFIRYINAVLAGNELSERHLPIDSEPSQLFDSISDGLILCALINYAHPGTVDVRAVNRKEKISVFQMTENLNLALNASKSIGCQVVNIGAADLASGNPILILGLIWQIIKIQLMSKIQLKDCPELIVLFTEDEDAAAFNKLSSEEVLVRWVNYHLKAAGSELSIKNFGPDVSDCEAYSILLNHLSPGTCPLLTEIDPPERAARILANAKAFGIEPFIGGKDITDGDRKLNLAFAAQLFRHRHGLVMPPRVSAASAAAAADEVRVQGMEEDAREGYVLGMWINALNIEGLHMKDFFEDCDSLTILKVIDSIQPGMVNWKKVSLDTKSRVRKIANANYIIELCSTLKLTLVNIGPLDIVDCNKKLLLALVWQLTKRHTLNVLQSLAAHEGLSEITEENIVQWANAKVVAAEQRGNLPYPSIIIKNFRDKQLRTGLYLLQLLCGIDPTIVDWELVNDGSQEEYALLNASYAISLARKIDACVFLTERDVVKGSSQMLFNFVAALWTTDLSYDKGAVSPHHSFYHKPKLEEQEPEEEH